MRHFKQFYKFYFVLRANSHVFVPQFTSRCGCRPHQLAVLATSPASELLCRDPPKPSPLSRGAVNVSQSHIAVARVLGTFSHTTCYPISFVLWTCFLDRSARGTVQAVEGAQRQSCYTRLSASCKPRPLTQRLPHQTRSLPRHRCRRSSAPAVPRRVSCRP